MVWLSSHDVERSPDDRPGVCQPACPCTANRPACDFSSDVGQPTSGGPSRAAPASHGPLTRARDSGRRELPRGRASKSRWRCLGQPNGRVWVGNFGFKGSQCEATPTSSGVSVFSPSGKPLSGGTGITAGGISWPQGTVSDRNGNIWIANCGNNTVTRFAGGDPGQSSILTGGSTAMGKPFDIVIDRFGNSWVTSSATNQVFAFDSQGTPLAGSPFSGGGLSKPLGIATDSLGNQWVANSAVIDYRSSAVHVPEVARPVFLSANQFRQRVAMPSTGCNATPVSKSMPQGMCGYATTGRKFRLRLTQVATDWWFSLGQPPRCRCH